MATRNLCRIQAASVTRAQFHILLAVARPRYYRLTADGRAAATAGAERLAELVRLARAGSPLDRYVAGFLWLQSILSIAADSWAIVTDAARFGPGRRLSGR